jgi:uncharacterized iron-regulated membrane protein
MTGLVRKIHIYAGLLTFAQLIVYGIAGLTATFQPGLERPKTAQAVRRVPFTVPANATDKQVADDAFRTLKLPLTRPMPEWALRRTPEGHLLLDFYNINGIYRVAVLEDEGKLRVEEIRNGFWLFLEDIHAATTGDAEAPGLIHAWGAWNEAAMWTLLLFCASGVYLWLAARARFLWAWASLVAGAVSLAGIWRLFQ